MTTLTSLESVSLNSYTGFVPKRVLQHFTDNPQPLDSAWSECIDGVVLYIALEGFKKTQIQLLNSRIIELIVTTVQTYGGDIIFLDAYGLLILWPWEDKASHVEIRLASFCSLQILEQLFATNPTEKSEEPLTASVKIGISASDQLFFSTIGGFQNRWQFLLSGKAVVEAREAVLFAKPGEAIISPSAWENIKENSEGIVLNDRGFTRLSSLKKFSPPLNISSKLPTVHSKGLQQFLVTQVPPPIQVELSDAQKQLWCYMDRSELRCMTCLFLHLPEMTMDWNSESKVQKIYATFQRIVGHNLGIDVKNGMSCEGITFYAIFGCPVYVYEQHSARALLAAIALRKELLLSRLPFKLGVVAANWFCGVMGPKSRRNYAFYSKFGCERIKAIIANGETYQISTEFTKDRYTSYPKQQNVQVKHPLLFETGCFPSSTELSQFTCEPPAQIPRGNGQPSEPSEKHSQFVLRHKALNLMLEKLQDLCERKSCGAVILEGQQGAGKSFLVNEFIRIAQEKGAPVKIIHGYCCICDKPTKFFPLRKAFSQLRQAKTEHQHMEAIAGHTSAHNFLTEDSSKTTTESNVTSSENSNSNSYDDDHSFYDDMSYSSYNSGAPISNSNLNTAPVSNNTSIPIPSNTTASSQTSNMTVPISPQSSSSSNPISNGGTRYISPSTAFCLTQSGKLKRVMSSSQLEDLTDDLLQYQEILDEFLTASDNHDDGVIHPSQPIDHQNKALILACMLIRILENESEEYPILCVIENAQWADDGTISFISQCLNRKMKSVLFIIATRTPSKNPVLTEKLLTKQTMGVRLELDLLTDTEIEKLSCYTLGVKSLPSLVLSIIQKYSQGILASVIELAHYLRTQGYIEIEEGICIPKSALKSIKYQSDFISHYALHAIMNTIDDLKPSLRIILEVAAVTDSFDCNLLSLCAPALHQFEISEQLKELHKQGIIQQNPEYKPPMFTRSSFDINGVVETVDEYIFSKGCWKEAIYSMIYPSRKQHIHSIAATYYETKDLQAKKSPDIKKLALHYSNANLYSTEIHEKAIFYLEKTGEMYLKKNANCQSVYYFSKLVDMHKRYKSQYERLYDEVRVAVWERMLGRAHTELAEYSQAIVHLESSLQLLKHPIPEDSKLGGVAQVVFEASKQALSFLVPKKSRTEDGPVVLETARTLYSAAEAYFFTHDYVKFSYCIMREFNLAEGLPETSPELAIAYVNMAFLAFFWGHQSLSNKYVQSCMNVLSSQDLPTSAYCFVRIGYFTLIAGDYYKAIDYINQAEMAKLGNKQIMFIGSAVSGMAYYMLGDYQNALKVFAQLLEFQKEDGSSFAILVARGCLAMVFCAINKVDDAIEILKAADRSSDFDFGSGRLCTDACKAWTHILKENWNTAYEIISSVIRALCVYRTSFSISRLVAYEMSCRVLYALIKRAHTTTPQPSPGSKERKPRRSNRAQISSLKVLMTDLLASFEQYNSGHPFGKVPWMFHVARLHRAMEDKQKALSVVSTALKYIHNEKVTMPYYQGALCYELSLLLDRGDMLRKAEEHLKTIGMDLSLLDRL